MPIHRPASVALLAVMFGLPAPALAAAKAAPGRLPDTARPQAYAIQLVPNLAKRVFTGTETITLMVDRPTTTFVLHANHLQTSKAVLDTTPARAITTDAQAQTLTLHFAKPVAPGPHRLSLAFAGTIDSLPRGLYAMDYRDGGKTKTMLATELEPADARRVFPLWDEPAHRATFSLSVDVPQGMTATSNMPIAKSTKLAKGLTRVAFQPTPRMSSYLLVLCMGELEFLTRTIEGVEVRIVTTRGKKERGRYALDAVAQLLPYYNDFFGVKYPLPKLDLIARPGGFGGAMENWGGITFYETRLLADPQRTSQSTREDIFTIIAHELAHQWFGNLVTMKWWDDLWLNEGFATWMEVKATEKLHPDWQAWLQESFYKDRTLNEDAQPTTHPIQVPIIRASDAESAFDGITYGKGMAFIRMLEAYLGPEAFQAGIQLYMKRHAYGNTATTDLWTALSDASKQPVSRIANAWITRPGFPLVSAGVTCTDGTSTMLLSQTRFTAMGITPAAPWPVPVVYSVFDQPHAVLLDGATKTVTLGDCDGVPVVNAGAPGFYRVRYEASLFQRLKAEFPQMQEANRVTLLNDGWALAQAGLQPVADYLALVDTLQPAAAPVVWQQAIGAFSRVRFLGRGGAAQGAVDRAIVRHLKPLAAKLSWSRHANESPTVTKLRPEVLNLLGRAGDAATLAEARKRYAAYLTKPASLDADLRETVLTLIGHTGTATDIAGLLAAAKKTEDTEAREELLYAAASTRDATLARRVLALSLDSKLDRTLGMRLVRRVGNQHPKLARAFMQQHAPALFAGRSPADRADAIAGVYAGFHDTAAADELLSYAKRVLKGEGMQDVRKEAARIRFDATVQQRLLPAVAQWAGAD